AQPPDIAGGVVAGERGEIDQRDRAEQPPRLPLLLDRAARRDGGGASLDGAAVHAERADDVEVERGARIPLDVIVGEARTRLLVTRGTLGRGEPERRFGLGLHGIPVGRDACGIRRRAGKIEWTPVPCRRGGPRSILCSTPVPPAAPNAGRPRPIPR